MLEQRINKHTEVRTNVTVKHDDGDVWVGKVLLRNRYKLVADALRGNYSDVGRLRALLLAVRGYVTYAGTYLR
jgi:hypothetical protein